MITITEKEAYSDAGHLIRRTSDPHSAPFRRCILLPGDTADSFIEVTDPEPPYTRQQYKEEVRRLIARRYTIEDEIALQRQYSEKQDEWQEYYAYCEQCKTLAAANLTQAPDTTQPEGAE